MFYSPSENGFYSSEIHNNMPLDVVPITDQNYYSLLESQRQGKAIQAGEGGGPIALDVLQTAPTSLTMKQARLALLAAGYLDAVEAGVSVMPRASQIAWEFAATVDRGDPLTATLAAALGLDAAALDALFTAGAAL